MKGFKIHVFFKNLEILKKRKGVKNSDIERYIKVSLGYLSRMKNDGKNTVPSINVIVEIANYFGITVDTLLFTDLSCGNNLERIHKVLDKIVRDMQQGDINWKFGERHFGLFQSLWREIFELPDPNNLSCYVRPFFDHSGEFGTFIGPYFIGEHSSGMKILIIKVALLSGEEGWEMYFLNKEKQILRNDNDEFIGEAEERVATGIYHTFGNHREDLEKRTNGLIHAIESYTNDVFISFETKDAIDDFLGNYERSDQK